jgi:hypothetical protein
VNVDLESLEIATAGFFFAGFDWAPDDFFPSFLPPAAFSLFPVERKRNQVNTKFSTSNHEQVY